MVHITDELESSPQASFSVSQDASAGLSGDVVISILHYENVSFFLAPCVRFCAEDEHQVGDMSGEDVINLDFPEVQSLPRSELTTINKLSDQLTEILSELDGEVYIEDISQQIYYSKLDQSETSLSELKEVLNELEKRPEYIGQEETMIHSRMLRNGTRYFHTSF